MGCKIKMFIFWVKTLNVVSGRSSGTFQCSFADAGLEQVGHEACV